jgi:hypothetical protein
VSEHDEPEGYDGDVTILVDGDPGVSARAVLVARFDPLAGHVVWTGRVAADVLPRTRLAITTPHGTGHAEATERDVWGNTRVTGLDRPPFPVELLETAEDPDVHPRCERPAGQGHRIRRAAR